MGFQKKRGDFADARLLFWGGMPFHVQEEEGEDSADLCCDQPC
jgi:hypothetical protein